MASRIKNKGAYMAPFGRPQLERKEEYVLRCLSGCFYHPKAEYHIICPLIRHKNYKIINC